MEVGDTALFVDDPLYFTAVAVVIAAVQGGGGMLWEAEQAVGLFLQLAQLLVGQVDRGLPHFIQCASETTPSGDWLLTMATLRTINAYIQPTEGSSGLSG